MKTEFEYPMWFKGRISGKVVKFDGLCSGTVIVNDRFNKVGDYSSRWCAHTNDIVWVDVTAQYKKPFDVVEKEESHDVLADLHDKLMDMLQNGYSSKEKLLEDSEKHRIELFKYFNAYALLNTVKVKKVKLRVEDTIENQNMNYNQGRIFKIASSFNGKSSDRSYKLGLENIIFYARRELARIKKDTL